MRKKKSVTCKCDKMSSRTARAAQRSVVQKHKNKQTKYHGDSYLKSSSPHCTKKKAKVLTSHEALQEVATAAFHVSIHSYANIHRYLHTYPHPHRLPYFLTPSSCFLAGPDSLVAGLPWWLSPSSSFYLQCIDHLLLLPSFFFFFYKFTL